MSLNVFWSAVQGDATAEMMEDVPCRPQSPDDAVRGEAEAPFIAAKASPSVCLEVLAVLAPGSTDELVWETPTVLRRRAATIALGQYALCCNSPLCRTRRHRRRRRAAWVSSYPLPAAPDAAGAAVKPDRGGGRSGTGSVTGSGVICDGCSNWAAGAEAASAAPPPLPPPLPLPSPTPSPGPSPDPTSRFNPGAGGLGGGGGTPRRPPSSVARCRSFCQPLYQPTVSGGG